jgi:hypothetical protein
MPASSITDAGGSTEETAPSIYSAPSQKAGQTDARDERKMIQQIV